MPIIEFLTIVIAVLTAVKASQLGIKRSSSNSILAGVCWGIAQHFNWPVMAVRIIVFAAAAIGGAGAIAYIVLALILPEEN